MFFASGHSSTSKCRLESVVCQSNSCIHKTCKLDIDQKPSFAALESDLSTGSEDNNKIESNSQLNCSLYDEENVYQVESEELIETEGRGENSSIVQSSQTQDIFQEQQQQQEEKEEEEEKEQFEVVNCVSSNVANTIVHDLTVDIPSSDNVEDDFQVDQLCTIERSPNQLNGFDNRIDCQLHSPSQSCEQHNLGHSDVYHLEYIEDPIFEHIVKPSHLFVSSCSELTQPVETLVYFDHNINDQTEFSVSTPTPDLDVLHSRDAIKQSNLHIFTPTDSFMNTTIGVSEIVTDPTALSESFGSSYHCSLEQDCSKQASFEQSGKVDFNTCGDGHNDDDADADDDHDDDDDEGGGVHIDGIQAKAVYQKPVETSYGINDEIHNGFHSEMNGHDNDVENMVQMTFNEIKQDLEKKNVIGSLQPQAPEEYLMHLHRDPANIRAQDIVVLNPQTGEVLGSDQRSLESKISHNFSKSIVINCAETSSPQASNMNSVQNGNLTNQQQNDDSSFNSSNNNTTRSSPKNEKVALNEDGRHPSDPNKNCHQARQTYKMSECSVAQVIVYLNRALVVRRVRPRFNANEVTDVVFEQLSPAIDKDSIRVEIRGAATILDVAFSAKSLSIEHDTWSQTINELQILLRQSCRQVDSLVNCINRTNKQRNVLETFANILVGNKQNEGLTNGLANSNESDPFGSPQMSRELVQQQQQQHQQQQHQQSSLSLNSNLALLDTPNPYDPKNVETLHRFLNIYKDEAERLDASLLDATEELEQVEARIQSLEKEIKEIELKQDEHLARELSVLVEPRETGQVEMIISYVVNQCGWKPSYDIRIFNSDGSMKIVYYGMVQQATGENWETRHMTLSTAQPGTGGIVPHLGLQKVQFRRDPSPAIPTKGLNAGQQSLAVAQPSTTSNYSPLGSNKTKSCQKIGGPFRRSNRSTLTSFHESANLVNGTESERDSTTPINTLQRGGAGMDSVHGTSARSATARLGLRKNITSSMLLNSSSTTPSYLVSSGRLIQLSQNALPPQPPVGSIATLQLDVPRPPTLIRCDNEPHRVTVGLLDLQPRYEYVAVPKRSLSAYLKATAKNSTDFSILAGSMNIYADNTFIGKSDIRAVAPGEEFSCHLGVENGIKIFYRPLFKNREGSGSSKQATMIFKQLIEVRNTFNRRIRLTVVDQVPVSGEEKIKVNLLEPIIKHPEKYDKNKPIRMNKCNNVEWDLDLDAGETRELVLKYSVDHPVNEDLDITAAET